jgi:hypothetical protein
VVGCCEDSNEPSGSMRGGGGVFLSSCVTVSFSRRTLLRGVSLVSLCLDLPSAVLSKNFPTKILYAILISLVLSPSLFRWCNHHNHFTSVQTMKILIMSFSTPSSLPANLTGIRTAFCQQVVTMCLCFAREVQPAVRGVVALLPPPHKVAELLGSVILSEPWTGVWLP